MYFIGNVTWKQTYSLPSSPDDLFDGRPLYEWIQSQSENFLRTYFDGTLYKDWLQQKGFPDFNVDHIGNLLWGQDNSLYGLSNPMWWGASSDMKIVKLLDSSGNRDLKIVDLTHATEKPSLMKIRGEYLYYRYAILDNSNMETGAHKLARKQYSSEGTTVDEELLTDPALSGKMLEILSYDVTPNNSTLYFSALDYNSNEVIAGKIDLLTKAYSPIQSTTSFSIVRAY